MSCWLCVPVSPYTVEMRLAETLLIMAYTEDLISVSKIDVFLTTHPIEILAPPATGTRASEKGRKRMRNACPSALLARVLSALEGRGNI